MADYYPLISRAVAGLERNNGENRRSVYERARAALIAQLRGVTPALPEGDITRERLALEEAIRKVEAEAARAFAQSGARGRDQDRYDDAPPRAQPRPPTPPRPERGEPRAEMPPPRRPLPPPPMTAPVMPRRQADTVFDQPAAAERAPEPPPPSAAPPRHPLRRPLPDRRGGSDASVAEFRSVVSEANELGGASARANQSARDAYAAAVPAPATDYDNRREREPRMYDQRGDGHEPTAMPVDFDQPMLEPSYADDARPAPPRMRQQQQPAADDEFEAEEEVRRPRRSYKELLKGAGIVAAVACLGGVLLWQWPTVVSFYQRMRAPAVTEVRDVPPGSSRTKITDRVPAAGDTTSSDPAPVAPAPGANVAQKVVLYEEDPADPNGKRFVGSAIWRNETVSPGPGQAPEMTIRADIELPERKLAITMIMQREKEKSPISHTVEVHFKMPADFPSGGILNVPGILMKQSEQTRGMPLAGSSSKVTGSYFLIGLSGIDAEKARNVQLLKERSWIDIPLIYTNNRRAILAIEKGTPGERVFAEAFKVWKQ